MHPLHQSSPRSPSNTQLPDPEVYWEYPVPSLLGQLSSHSSLHSAHSINNNPSSASPSIPKQIPRPPPKRSSALAGIPSPSKPPSQHPAPADRSALSKLHSPSTSGDRRPLRLAKRLKHRRQSALHTRSSTSSPRPACALSIPKVGPTADTAAANAAADQKALCLRRTALTSLESHLHRRVSSVGQRSENEPAVQPPAHASSGPEGKGKQRAWPNKGSRDAPLKPTGPPREAAAATSSATHQLSGLSSRVRLEAARAALHPRQSSQIPGQAVHPPRSADTKGPDPCLARHPPCPPAQSRTTHTPNIPPPVRLRSVPLLSSVRTSLTCLSGPTSGPSQAPATRSIPTSNPAPISLNSKMSSEGSSKPAVDPTPCEPWDVDEDAEFGDLLVKLVDRVPLKPHTLPRPASRPETVTVAPRRATSGPMVPVSPWTKSAAASKDKPVGSCGVQRPVSKVVPVSKPRLSANGPVGRGYETTGEGAGRRPGKQVLSRQLSTSSIRYPDPPSTGTPGTIKPASYAAAVRHVPGTTNQAEKNLNQSRLKSNSTKTVGEKSIITIPSQTINNNHNHECSTSTTNKGVGLKSCCLIGERRKSCLEVEEEVEVEEVESSRNNNLSNSSSFGNSCSREEASEMLLSGLGCDDLDWDPYE